MFKFIITAQTHTLWFKDNKSYSYLQLEICAGRNYKAYNALAKPAQALSVQFHWLLKTFTSQLYSLVTRVS